MEIDLTITLSHMSGDAAAEEEIVREIRRTLNGLMLFVAGAEYEIMSVQAPGTT